jgi:hypothetical protein
MRRYISIISVYLAALMAFMPFDSAQDAATTATTPIIPDTATDAIIAEFASPATPAIHDDGLVQMLTPTTLNFFIDPYGLLGLGEVYSQSYPLQNLGTTDLMVIITDINVTFSNDTDFEALSAPYEAESGSDRKAIYLVLNFSGADIPPAILTDPARKAPVIINLPAGGEPVLMNVSGSINSRPAIDWMSGDVLISLKYKIEAFPAVPLETATPATPATPATDAVATDPAMASPGDNSEDSGPWEPVGDTQPHEETEPAEATDPEPAATSGTVHENPEQPATGGTLPDEEEPVASDGILPEEPPPQESPQPPEATPGVV